MIIIFIHRFLQSFLLPPLNSLLIILLGVYFFKLQRTRAQLIIIVGSLSLYLQATPIVAYKLNHGLAPAPMQLSKIYTTQALVVLGGGISTSVDEYKVGAVSNSETFIRIRYAAYLAKKNPQLPIFVSGGAIDSHDSEASLMKKALQQEFNVKNPIFMEPDSKTTSENAKYSARLLQQYGISTVVLVSSASHIRRASALFERNGIRVTAAPTGFYPLGYYRLLWFIPSSGAMLTTATVLHEVIGYWYDLGP